MRGRQIWVLGVVALLVMASCGDDETVASGGAAGVDASGGALGSAGVSGSAGSAGSAGSVGSAGSAGSDAGRDAPPVGGDRSFRKITLSTEFYCEGANFADFDNDGVNDVVAGPYWYRGPDFQTRTELYTPVVADPVYYSDNFFAFPRDFNRDGWVDVLVIGFPGWDASWFENPQRAAGHWTRHVVFGDPAGPPGVDIESPAYTDLTGDGEPELVFATGGQLGWAGPNPSDARLPWTFRPLSPVVGFANYTHGLGVGDVDGDGRADVLEATGFWRQPPALGALWQKQAHTFGRPGGAQMFATDVDGDGDRDVVTTIWAHGWGLSWFEQVQTPTPGFAEHVIVSDQAPTTGLVMHEPHALALVDMNGDGLEDLVTGERFWAHRDGWGPDFGAPAMLYWFELVRDGSRVEYVPHLIDDASGVGTQVVAGDISADGLPDIVVANKKGTFVFIQEIADGG